MVNKTLIAELVDAVNLKVDQRNEVTENYLSCADTKSCLTNSQILTRKKNPHETIDQFFFALKLSVS